MLNNGMIYLDCNLTFTEIARVHYAKLLVLSEKNKTFFQHIRFYCIDHLNCCFSKHIVLSFPPVIASPLKTLESCDIYLKVIQHIHYFFSCDLYKSTKQTFSLYRGPSPINKLQTICQFVRKKLKNIVLL